jgi:chorismate synthase
MNVYGNNIRIEIFGESHGPAVGITVDGLPAGVKLDNEYINSYMARRRSDGVLGTGRVEADEPEILSGVLNGFTTGAPLTCLIHNRAKNSGDYPEELIMPRPSHADYPAHVKYGGYNDIRGGGHFSGRLTAPLVFAGALIAQILEMQGITVGAHIKRIASAEDKKLNSLSITSEELKALKNKKIPCIDENTAKNMVMEIERGRFCRRYY